VDEDERRGAGSGARAPQGSVGRHQPRRPARPYRPAGNHRAASLLQRWLTGTLRYGYSIDQLDYYLNELTFRFNRRTARSRGLLFLRLLQQAVATDPHPYRELTASGDVDALPMVLDPHAPLAASELATSRH
jgi:hypothetical protein